MTTEAEPAGLAPWLLEILACPADLGGLAPERAGAGWVLTCDRCGSRYPVRDGIPVLLLDEAEPGPRGLGVPLDRDDDDRRDRPVATEQP